MPILGLRGVGNFATSEAPQNWREGILRYYPNGETPLIALSSQGKNEATDHYLFNWWDKALPGRRLFVNNAAGYDSTATSIVTDLAAVEYGYKGRSDEPTRKAHRVLGRTLAALGGK